ncbi:MAG TPA: Minf_1886 family protein, partial [Chthoniobacterales bacterium]
TVLSYWGIRSTEDIGHMVFNLIGAGIFGKTEEDSIEDFKNVFDFQEAFVKPFEPEKPAQADMPASRPAPAPKLS